MPSTRSGSVPFGRPDYEIPDLPRDITLVNDERLMQLFTEYVSWQNYAATEFAQAEVTEERAQAHVRFLEATTMAMADVKAKVTVVRAQMADDPRIERARQEQLVAYASRKMTQVIMENCERCAALVSRELSRRIGAGGVERRNLRWNP